MRKHYFLLALFCAVAMCANALDYNLKDELRLLDEALAERPGIEARKRARIDSLRRAAALADEAYPVYKCLYEEYKSYNYDTALFYVRRMEQEATPAQQPEVQLCRSFVYLSGGLFKEADDILARWQSPDSTLCLLYYITYARLLWDMADHAEGEIGAAYNREGVRMNESALTYLTPADTARYWYALAVRDLRVGNHARSIERCHLSLGATQPSVHFRAMTASTLAFLYRVTGRPEEALHYYIDAAICDIRSSTNEAVAMRNVAELLFEADETQLADRYIHLAMQDAQRYHARHRQMDVAQTLPIIEEQMLSQLALREQQALILLGIATLLLLIAVVSIIVVARKNKTVHAARHTINRMNRSLLEANKLKEELLGTLLVGQSRYLNSVRQYQQDVKQYAADRRWAPLLTIPKNADAHLQRMYLDRELDSMLLTLYPTFVRDFNALLRPGAQITLKKDELLNAQLRIFALIRLGIVHNEVIAEILDYSINTVYNYKTRVIAQSDLSADDFYHALMQIPSFSR